LGTGGGGEGNLFPPGGPGPEFDPRQPDREGGGDREKIFFAGGPGPVFAGWGGGGGGTGGGRGEVHPRGGGASFCPAVIFSGACAGGKGGPPVFTPGGTGAGRLRGGSRGGAKKRKFFFSPGTAPGKFRIPQTLGNNGWGFKIRGWTIAGARVLSFADPRAKSPPFGRRGGQIISKKKKPAGSFSPDPGTETNRARLARMRRAGKHRRRGDLCFRGRNLSGHCVSSRQRKG